MRCASCGSELLPGKKFCHVCGAAAAIACPRCGATVAAGFRFCPDCGLALGAEPPLAAAHSPSPMPAAVPAVAAAAPPDDRLTRHVPVELVRKIRESAGSMIGERKLVTVLFCDLVGSTAIAEQLDPEEYRDLLDEYLELAFREVYQVEGIVNQLNGDGFMALFGAPVAHEDAPHRAISAALGIRDAVLRLGDTIRERDGIEIQVRIGINTGPVVVGAVGSDLKTDYSAIGDTTNLAARLQSLAEPGSVLISESTHRLVLGFYDVRPRGPLNVKGKSEPISAFEVDGKSRGATPMGIAEARGLTPLVGRDQELAQLLGSWDRLLGGLPQVFALVGDAGSGKSRAIYEFRARLSGQAVTVLEARCSSLSQGLSYAPIVAMLRQFFEIPLSETARCSCDRLAERVRPFDPGLDRVYPFLCRLLALSPDGFGDRSADEIKRETWEAVAMLVAELSRETPVLMIVEDLHWIDDASREMIELAVARLVRARMMILVSHRPDYESAWRFNAAFTQLRLRPLTEPEAAEITTAVAGGRLPLELEREIVGRAEGNPFYLEELTRTVIEEGYVVRGDREIRATRPVAEMRVPATVQELLAARLDRVGASAKRVVQVAAVLGRQFRRTDLATLLAGDGIDVERELETLERRGVVHRKTLLSDDEYRFGESLTLEVAYEGLLLKERRVLHERVASLLESANEERTAERSALLAHHLARGENRGRALAALLQAAKDAEQIPSYRTAAGLYRQGWDLAQPLLQSPRVDEATRSIAVDAAIGLARMGAIYGAVDPRAVEPIAGQAGRIAEERGDAASLATLLSLQGSVVANIGRERFADGVALAERGLAVAENAGLTAHAVLVARSSNWLHLLDGRFEDARLGSERSVRLLEAEGHGERLTDHYFAAQFGRVLWAFFSDELELAQEMVADNYRRASQAGNRTSRSGSAGYLAWIALESGRAAEALERAEEAIAIGREVSNVTSIRTGASIAILARSALGEPIGAELVELVEQRMAHPTDLVLKVRLVVEALLAAGEEERARRMLEAAARLAGGRLCEMWAALAAADLDNRLGVNESPAALVRGSALARELGSRSGRAFAALVEGERALARGEIETAAASLREARTLARAIGFVRLVARADAASEELAGAVEVTTADVGT